MEEPAVDFCDVENLVHRNALFERFEYGKQTLVGKFGKFLADIFARVFIEIERRKRNFRAAHGLHDRHFETRADGHHFARRLHAGAQLALCV